MWLIEKLLGWAVGLFPEKWRRWLDLGVILGVGLVAVWGWVDGMKKDVVIASQKVEIAAKNTEIIEIRAASNFILMETRASNAEKEKEHADAVNKSHHEHNLDLATAYDLHRVLADQSSKITASDSGGCSLPETSPGKRIGDGAAKEREIDTDAAALNACVTSRDCFSGLIDGITLMECQDNLRINKVDVIPYGLHE